MSAYDKSGTTVKSDERLFAIIDCLRELDGAGPTELAEHMGLPKSTVYGHLATLKHNEFVSQEDGEYRLGLKFLDYGVYARDRHDLAKIANESIRKIAEQTGETAWIVVEEYGLAVYLSKAEGENSVQNHARIGRREPLHQLAAGKAILAHLPDERVREIIDQHGLPAATENTISDEGELFDELDEIREDGYAFSNREVITGTRAVGAPILDERNANRVLGAISVAGPAKRLRGDWYREDLPNLMLGTANEIELKFRYS
ncbi:MAG: IclR family transcriptional regulator [Salinigranum sp.]